ncbi:MAG: hypothetical protein CMI20_09650 [Opitutae bacterium]|nr:hypothetical protein [Opitutae bacterium]|tara:strand:- start:340 stop:549 length:210 start_codon:yes stop_codon:yes gene_type:complete
MKVITLKGWAWLYNSKGITLLKCPQKQNSKLRIISVVSRQKVYLTDGSSLSTRWLKMDDVNWKRIGGFG